MQSNWYKTLFDKSSESVLIIEPGTWLLVDANEPAKNLLQLSNGFPKNTTIPEFKKIYKLLSDSKSGNVYTGQIFKTQNGDDINLQVNAGIIEYEKKQYIQAILKNPEETDLLTERLIQADKLVLLGQLSAGVAHEIRNPLAAVNLNLQLLARKYAEGTSEFNSIQTALQGVERISRIVEITLNFSKPSNPDIKEININQIITSTMDLVASELKKKQIKVESQINEKLPMISADAKQIQQVLINLLTNAADSINGDGKIIISTFVEESKHRKMDNVVIEIEDNGIGISQEELPKIFNPFFTKKSNGTGLGLSISQRIVQQHNGKIEVLSKVDKGTVFKVHLPL